MFLKKESFKYRTYEEYPLIKKSDRTLLQFMTVPKGKPIIQFGFIPVMPLMESMRRHADAGISFADESLTLSQMEEQERKIHCLKSFIAMEMIYRAGEKHITPEERSRIDNYQKIICELIKENIDVSKMSKEELSLNQDTCLSYFHKKSTEMLLKIGIIEIVGDYTLFFIAEINPSLGDIFKRVITTSLDVSLEDIIVNIALKQEIKPKRKLLRNMTKLCGYIFVFGKNGIIWKL